MSHSYCGDGIDPGMLILINVHFIGARSWLIFNFLNHEEHEGNISVKRIPFVLFVSFVVISSNGTTTRRTPTLIR